jgi:hypothetical protein
MRQDVPVDRGTGARQIGRTGQTEAVAVRQPAVFLAPAGALYDLRDALTEADSADSKVIGSQ